MQPKSVKFANLKLRATCQVTSADHMINLYGPTVIANTISKEELADTTVIINEPEKGEENYGFVETELSRDDNEDENLVLHRWQAAKENVTSLQALAINSTNTSRKNSMILSRKSSMASNTSKVTKVDMDEQREDELSGLITAAVKARRESKKKAAESEQRGSGRRRPEEKLRARDLW